jgi:hypothetical protein
MGAGSTATDLLRREHGDIRCLLLRMRAVARDGAGPTERASATTLEQLRQSIQRHTHAEDDYLYPLFDTGDEAGRTVAGPFRDEMLDITAVCQRFFARWHCPAERGGHALQFAADVESLSRLMEGRMHREERALYPAFDVLCATGTGVASRLQ